MESSIEVGELLRSELTMSNAVLLLKDEATSASGRQPQAMENAVRLALLVTRSFVTFLSDALSKDSHEDVLQLVSLLQLSDVFVKLGQSGSPEAAQSKFLGSSYIPSFLWVNLPLLIFS